MSKLQTYEPSFTILPPDYYEATITEVKEVQNKFYDASKPKEGYPTQVEVSFVLPDPDYPDNEIVLIKWLAPVLTPKSHLTSLLKAVDPQFNPQGAVLDSEQLSGKKVRVNVIQKEDSKGVMRNRIIGFAVSKSK